MMPLLTMFNGAECLVRRKWIDPELRTLNPPQPSAPSQCHRDPSRRSGRTLFELNVAVVTPTRQPNDKS